MAATNIKIKSSVGRSSVNHSADVKLVQKLLNEQIRPPLRYLKEDGIFGASTQNAIRRFQSSDCKMQQPTDRIEPGDATLNKLLGLHNAAIRSPLAAPPPSMQPNSSPTAKAIEANADVARERICQGASRGGICRVLEKAWRSIQGSRWQSSSALSRGPNRYGCWRCCI